MYFTFMYSQVYIIIRNKASELFSYVLHFYDFLTVVDITIIHRSFFSSLFKILSLFIILKYN